MFFFYVFIHGNPTLCLSAPLINPFLTSEETFPVSSLLWDACRLETHLQICLMWSPWVRGGLIIRPQCNFSQGPHLKKLFSILFFVVWMSPPFLNVHKCCEMCSFASSSWVNILEKNITNSHTRDVTGLPWTAFFVSFLFLVFLRSSGSTLHVHVSWQHKHQVQFSRQSQVCQCCITVKFQPFWVICSRVWTLYRPKTFPAA